MSETGQDPPTNYNCDGVYTGDFCILCAGPLTHEVEFDSGVCDACSKAPRNSSDSASSITILDADSSGQITLSLTDEACRTLSILALDDATPYDSLSDVFEDGLNELINQYAEGVCPACESIVYRVTDRGPNEGVSFPCGCEATPEPFDADVTGGDAQ